MADFSLDARRALWVLIDRSSIEIYTGVFLGVNVLDRWKNHGWRQKIPEGTSSATHCQMLRIQAMYFDSIRCYASYASYCVTINTGVFLGNVFGPPQKPWLWTEKNKKDASSPGLGVRTAANAVSSSVVPTEFAAEPTPRRQISNFNSSPSTKKTTEFSFELFSFH